VDEAETVFARICLERGWVTRDQIAEVLRRRAAAGGEGPAFSSLMVSLGLLTSEQAESARQEATRVVGRGAYAVVRKEDASLGHLLVKAGHVSMAQVREAVEAQEEEARGGKPSPRLGQILIDKGYVTQAVIDETLRRQQEMARFRCESCGAVYAIPSHEPGKRYLCPRCALPLSASAVIAAPPAPDPEEVRRCATNPKNVVGKYVAVKELGRGGMASVYKAWDTQARRWVALKIMAVHGGVEALVRFRREAETAAALQHPHIVPIYDVGEAGDKHYISMKYLEGETLAGRRLPARRACEIMAAVAQAVEHAHGRDIVHRDLKPQNVLLDSAGKPYVLDFGLAKDLFGSFNITAPGTVMGSPSYMSPEQAAGQVSKVDQRSDVYSMGAILYEILTGQPPFKGETPVETIHQVMGDPVRRPTELVPEIPAELEAIVLKALEKDRGRRYPTAAAFGQDLEAHLKGQPRPSQILPAVVVPKPAAPAPRRERSEVGMVVVLIALLVMAATVFVWLRGGVWK
jgi:hypothetical protein